MPIADRSSRDGDRVVLGPASLFDSVLDHWKLLTAASLVGIADASMELGVAYVKEREQFGVPVGSFQAVQHGLADLPVAIDGGRLLTHKAAWALDTIVDGLVDWANNDITDGPTLATMALLFAADAAVMATDRSLHYHGGYGFAEEYDIQMYYRRARGWSLILNDPTTVSLSLADRLFGKVGG
jgi:alkylation response protein AidB-like acyl-CoA dehydrogenase